MERMLYTIRPGDAVTFTTPQGQTRTGRCVFAPSPAKPWAVVDCGGAHGRPAVVTDANLTSVGRRVHH